MLRRSPSPSPNRPLHVPASPASVRSNASGRSSSRDQRSSRQFEGKSAVDVFRSHQQEAACLLEQLRSAIVSHRQPKPAPQPPALELSVASSSTNVSPVQQFPHNQADARSVTPLSLVVDGHNAHRITETEPTPPPAFSSVYSVISGDNPWERAAPVEHSDARSPFLARIAKQQRPSSTAGFGMTQRPVPPQPPVHPIHRVSFGNDATDTPQSSRRKSVKEPHTLSRDTAEVPYQVTGDSRNSIPVLVSGLPLRAKPLPGVESAAVATARISSRHHVVTPSRSVTPLRPAMTFTSSTPLFSYGTPAQAPRLETATQAWAGSYAVIHGTPKRRQDVSSHSQDAGTQTYPPVEIVRDYQVPDRHVVETRDAMTEPLSPPQSVAAHHSYSQHDVHEEIGEDESRFTQPHVVLASVDDSLLSDVQAVVLRSAHLRQKLDASLTELTETRVSRSLNLSRSDVSLPHTPVSTPPRPTHTLEDLASVSSLPGLAGLWESKAPMKRTQSAADSVAERFAQFSMNSGLAPFGFKESPKREEKRDIRGIRVMDANATMQGTRIREGPTLIRYKT